MFLRHRTVRSCPGNPAIKKHALPTKIEETRLNDLVQRLRDGTILMEEKDELVRGHIRLALHIAGRYIYHFPHKRDTMIAEAMFAIAYAIAKSQERLKDNNFTAYCVSCIHRFVSRESDNNMVTKDRFCRARKQGILLETPSVLQIKEDMVVDPEPHKLAEMYEVLATCITTALEREIMVLRVQGHNDSEIAELLGKTKARIGQIRADVARRFAEKMEM